MTSYTEQFHLYRNSRITATVSHWTTGRFHSHTAPMTSARVPKTNVLWKSKYIMFIYFSGARGGVPQLHPVAEGTLESFLLY